MSVIGCPRYGGAESVGPVCLLCGTCGDAEPEGVNCPDGVVMVTVALGWTQHRVGEWAPTTLTTLAFKQCECGAVMFRRPSTFVWECGACESWWVARESLLQDVAS